MTHETHDIVLSFPVTLRLALGGVVSRLPALTAFLRTLCGCGTISGLRADSDPAYSSVDGRPVQE